MRLVWKGLRLWAALLTVVFLASVVSPSMGQDKDKKDEKKTPVTVTAAQRPDKAWLTRHEGFVAEAKKGGVDVLLLGDACMDEWRRAPDEKATRGGKKVFDKELAPLKVANFGVGGDKTQNLLWRLQNGELDGIQPKVVVILIGTNNSNGTDHTAQEIADGIKACVDEVKKKLEKSKVLVLGILPRGEKPFPQRKITEVNKLIKSLDDGKRVKFLDIGPKFVGEGEVISREVMSNYLHLTEKGYQIFADAIKDPLNETLKP